MMKQVVAVFKFDGESIRFESYPMDMAFAFATVNQHWNGLLDNGQWVLNEDSPVVEHTWERNILEYI